MLTYAGLCCVQVGIPEVFAKRLSWPEPVNQFNLRRLRQAVLNGADVWPGANYVVDEKGNKVDLSKKGQQFRTALAKQLQRVDARGLNWKVGRHLNNGDFVLVNRQPTLHKVSLMAHKVRVNAGQRVIRMHYANCKSYNADFDGDEINVHFPQDQLGRAEAATIVQNDLQYMVPTDGSPVRGLIQDHVIAGVQICQMNRTFTREEYAELSFLMLTDLAQHLELPNNQILTVPPAYVRPIRRWTGKQLITTILMNLLHDCPPLNTESGCKVKGVMVGQHKHEEKVVVRGNHFLTGCLDKNQIGSSAEGIVHAVFESYGAHKAGLLLTIFGRLFTHFAQTHRAFTCGVYDLMVTEEGNRKRAEILATANLRTLEVVRMLT
jgi:DNA-directed RNA polymerase I subunit RPA1